MHRKPLTMDQRRCRLIHYVRKRLRACRHPTNDPRRNSRAAPLSDWIRAYGATAEFFDRKLAASKERQ